MMISLLFPSELVDPGRGKSITPRRQTTLRPIDVQVETPMLAKNRIVGFLRNGTVYAPNHRLV